MAITHNKNYLAVGYSNGHLMVFDCNLSPTYTVAEFMGNNGEISSIQFSRDGINQILLLDEKNNVKMI